MCCVVLRVNGTQQSCQPLGDAWLRMHTLMVIRTTHMYHHWKSEGMLCQTPQTDQHVRLSWTVAWPWFRSPDGAILKTGGCTKIQEFFIVCSGN